MIKEYQGEDFNKLTNEGTVVVQYYAEWCGPCQMLKPVIAGISEEMTDVNFYKVDIDAYREQAVDAKVQSIPTVVLYKDGNEVAREAGFKPKHVLEAWINENK